MPSTNSFANRSSTYRAPNTRGAPKADKITGVEIDLSLARLEVLANVMDRAVTIPGTNVTMGVDALLGIVPVVGDAISAMLASYLIWEARRLGVSKVVLVRMVANTTIDTVVGAIPIVGDVFDVAYRSNIKNLTLLKRHIEKKGLGGASQTIETTYRVE